MIPRPKSEPKTPRSACGALTHVARAALWARRTLVGEESPSPCGGAALRWTTGPPRLLAAAALGAGAAAGVVAAAASTGFLERPRPRWTWRSQYLWPGTTSREHRHFLPSVRRHRPGSGSMLLR